MSEPAFRTAIQDSRRLRQPLLAFNIVDVASLQGVLDVSRELDKPVIVQWSSRTVSFYGAKTISAIVRSSVERTGCAAFLHLDHCADDDVLESALAAGFDGIMADGSHLPFDQNVSWTRQWVGHAADAGAIVEGELGAIRGTEDGFIGGGGTEAIDLDEYLSFATSTGVDLLGADIGTAHGTYDVPPEIRFELPRALATEDAPGFVVHGCSGLQLDVLHELVRLRAVKLNYSTDLKHAWAAGVMSSLAAGDNPEPVAALRSARTATADMVRERWAMIGDVR